MASTDTYTCTLTEASQKKALTELHEDPRDRMDAVAALRTWVEQQPHITSPTDTWFLLRFLRARKFSQLEARALLEKYLTAHTKYPEWFCNIDPSDPDLLYFIKKGVLLTLPRRDAEGREVLLMRAGRLPADKTTKNDVMRFQIMMMELAMQDENTQVNGVINIVDLSEFTMKHHNMFSLEERRTMGSIWQKHMPVRIKGIHMYNLGSLAELLLSILKFVLSEKMQKRLHVHGQSLESLYKKVDKSTLPDEYLPDEYAGPSAGFVDNIIGDMLKRLTDETFRAHLRVVSDPKYGIDESKRPVKAEVASFRKLQID